MIDLTITLGTIVQTVVIIIGGLGFLFAMRDKINSLSTDMTDIKVDIKELNKVVIKIAVADTRLTNVEQDIRDLKHGKGFITEP